MFGKHNKKIFKIFPTCGSTLTVLIEQYRLFRDRIYYREIFVVRPRYGNAEIQLKHRENGTIQ